MIELPGGKVSKTTNIWVNFSKTIVIYVKVTKSSTGQNWVGQ